MDNNMKTEPMESEVDIKEESGPDLTVPIVEGNIKEEKELIIESDWLPIKLENEGNKELEEDYNQNIVSEEVVENNSEYEEFIIENFDESYDSDGDNDDYDYAASDDQDAGEGNYTEEVDYGENSSKSNSLHQQQIRKLISDNYISCGCPVCNEILPNYNDLKGHLTLNHKESIAESESNYYFSSGNRGVCQTCGQEFITQYSRYIHTQTHSDLTSNLCTYTCKICGFSAKQRYVQNHILKIHPGVVLELKPSSVRYMKCPICSDSYLKRQHLSYHFMDRHPYEYKSMFKYNCHLCKNGVFNEMELFLEHLIQKHFLNSWNILNYRKVFEDKDNFACVKCNRLFFQNDIYKLLSHFLQHETKFRWTCNFCCKKLCFTTSTFNHMCVKMMRYYKTENNTVKNSKKTESKIISLQEFEEHIRYVCPFCNEEFDKTIKWQQHMRTDHEIHRLKGQQMKVDDNDSKKLKCLVCDVVVANNPDQIHAHSFQHLQYKPYKCLLCLKYLNTLEMATDHALEHCRDNDSRYDIRTNLKMQCSVCNFENINDLKHYENKHNFFEYFFFKESDNSTMTCKICLVKCVQKEKKSCFEHLHNHFDEKTFKCKLCLKSYTTYKSMAEHLQQFHNAKPLNKQPVETVTDKSSNSLPSNVDSFSKFISFICPECNECMTTKINWEDHIKTHHSFFAESNLYIKAADGTLKCPTCSNVLSKKNCVQRQHKLTHMPNRSFMCNLCSERIISLTNIYGHFRRKHFAQGKFECPICSAILETEYQRTEHLKTIHPIEEWPECVCLICCRLLKNKLSLNRHMKTHKADRSRHTCEICGSKILQLRDFIEHLNKHKLRGEIKETISSNINDFNNIDVVAKSSSDYKSKEKNTQQLGGENEEEISSHSNDINNIDVEDKSVSDYKSNMKKWHVLHEFEEFVSYVCPDCNEGMTTQEHWRTHIRTQHDFFDESNLYFKDIDGSLKCPTCRVTVDARPRMQQRHKLRHMPFRSFMCNLCFDRFSSLDGLYVHFRRKHFAQGRFECPICFVILQTEYQRTEHLKKMHSREEWPDSVCLICYKVLANKQCLYNHMNTHKADRSRHTCNICGIKILKLGVFNVHMNRHKNRGETNEKEEIDNRIKKNKLISITSGTEIKKKKVDVE